MTTKILFQDDTSITLEGAGGGHSIWHRGPNVPFAVEDYGDFATVDVPKYWQHEFLNEARPSITGEEAEMPFVKEISFTKREVGK